MYCHLWLRKLASREDSKVFSNVIVPGIDLASASVAWMSGQEYLG